MSEQVRVKRLDIMGCNGIEVSWLKCLYVSPQSKYSVHRFLSNIVNFHHVQLYKIIRRQRFTRNVNASELFDQNNKVFY